MTTTNKKIEILKKVKILAEKSNCPGEKSAALHKLNQLMDQYGFTENDLLEEAVSLRHFKYRNALERQLLAQVAYKVLNCKSLEVFSLKRKGRVVSNLLGIECTIAQKVEIDFLFDFYLTLFQKEQHTLLLAFITKHNIFSATESSEEAKAPKLSQDELIKIFGMMPGLSEATPHKQIRG